MRRQLIQSCATFVFCSVSGGAAVAGDSIAETRTVEANGRIRVENVRGDVSINGWDRSEVSVTGELDDLAEAFVFETKGSVTRVLVEMPKRNVNWGDGSDLEIRVPHGSQLWFEGVSTDLDVHDVAGGARIKSISGDVVVRGVGDHVDVNTVSGDVSVEGSGGRIRVVTVSATADLKVDATEVKLNTVSGEFEADIGQFARLDASSVSGDLEVEGELGGNGAVDMSTVSGDLTLRLRGAVDARIEAYTGPGGDIDNDLTGDAPETAFPARLRLLSEAGRGSGQIRLKTVSGEIRLEED